jgi:hypothetical protein
MENRASYQLLSMVENFLTISVYQVERQTVLEM